MEFSRAWRRIAGQAGIALLLTAAAAARAELYELPPEGYDVIGAPSTTVARREDTLLDIARRHGIGYEDIVRANPGVDVWLPGEGTSIVLPTQYILPPGPRKGIVLNLAEYRMYYYPEPVKSGPAMVMTWPISIGRMDWETPLGTTRIVSMAKNPTWYPPQSVRDEHEADGDPLPRTVPPGPKNPLGAHAMRLGLPGYLIHGTNRPAGVGMRVTHGCIRMFPEDIEFLFGEVAVNTSVRIINAPVKLGWMGDELVMEVHPVLESAPPKDAALIDGDAQAGTGGVDAGETADIPPAVPVAGKDPLTHVTEQFIAITDVRAGELDWGHVEALIERADGMPATVGQGIKNAATSAAFE